MDTIHVTGIRAYGYTGYLAEEQVLGDAIEDTLDYRQAIEIVKHQIETGKFALVEKLATVIAEDILQLEGVRQVRVQLSKPAAPIPNFTGKITIDITRSR